MLPELDYENWITELQSGSFGEKVIDLITRKFFVINL